jgi:hypothetical protein
MSRSDRSNLLPAGSLFVVLSCGFCFPAHAVPQLSIANVAVDYEGEALLIYGSGFDNGDPPTVTLAGYPISLTLYSSDEIVVEFPAASFGPGDYRLDVSTGRSATRNDSYDLTIGAIGPEGPQGPEGPPGAIDPSRIYISQCAPPFASCFCQCEGEDEIALSASVSCDKEGYIGTIMYVVRDQRSNSLRAWIALCADTDESLGEYWCPLDFTVTCLRP